MRFLGLKVDHRVIVEWVVAGQTIGFVGALVGGFYAADRKKEVEALNARLVAVNKQLREQARTAKAGTYAPEGLTSSSNGNGNGAGAGAAAAVAAAHANDDSSPAAQEVIATLRTGKGMLKMRDGKAARGHFERALVLCRDPASGLETPWKAERKALRGLGAAAQLLGEQDAALALMKQVLDLSEKMGDTSGVADALGVIADIYTESAWRLACLRARVPLASKGARALTLLRPRRAEGELDKAGLWYDKYINAMQ